MSSTSSLPDNSPTAEAPSQADLAKEALREALTSEEGLKRLGRLVGLQSTRRGLRTEDAAVERDYAAQEGLLYGSKAQPASKGADAMDIMAAGNVYVNDPPRQPAQAAPDASKSSGSLLKTAALVALSLLGGGTGAGIAIPAGMALYQYLTRPKAEAPVEPTPPSDVSLNPGQLQIDVLPGPGE